MKRLLIAGFAALLASCSMFPEYKRPEVNTPAEFRGAPAPLDAKSLADLAMPDILADKSFFPEFQAACRNGIAYFSGHACARPARTNVFPGEEGKDSAGGARLITKVKVIGSRIVEIDCFFHQSEAEDPRIEVLVTPGIAGDGGDVMKT